MHALTRFLFPLPVARRSTTTLLGWWESRRPAYNLIVGAAGLTTLGTIQLLSLLVAHHPMALWWGLVVIYGIAANVCYTFGFLLELLLHRLWGDDVAPVGPTLFRHGLVFSVGLTLLPIGVAWVAAIASVVLRLF